MYHVLKLKLISPIMNKISHFHFPTMANSKGKNSSEILFPIEINLMRIFNN